MDFEKGVWTGLWLEGEMEKKLKEEVRVLSSGKLKKLNFNEKRVLLPVNGPAVGCADGDVEGSMEG